jgi:hypothetical protein
LTLSIFLYPSLLLCYTGLGSSDERGGGREVATIGITCVGLRGGRGSSAKGTSASTVATSANSNGWLAATGVLIDGFDDDDDDDDVKYNEKISICYWPLFSILFVCLLVL